MKSTLSEGRTYLFDELPLEQRIDLLKASTEVYYCLFYKDTETGRKYGLFKNNLTGDGLESKITQSYTVLGDEFGYDDVKVCPTGTNVGATFTIFLALIKTNPQLCQLVIINDEDGNNILCEGKSKEECLESLKKKLGVRLYFGEPTYFEERKRYFQWFKDIPSSDELYVLYNREYEFMWSPTISSFNSTSSYVAAVKTKSGKYNYLNLSESRLLSPIDFDELTSMGRNSCFSFRIRDNWYQADMAGVLVEPEKESKGWYQYDCLPDLIAGRDISRFKQNQYEEMRRDYAYWDPNESNVNTLLKKMEDWAKTYK